MKFPLQLLSFVLVFIIWVSPTSCKNRTDSVGNRRNQGSNDRDPDSAEIRTGKRPCKSDFEYYHNETSQCYDFVSQRTKNPCGEFQSFFPVDRDYIECSCLEPKNLCQGPYVFHRPLASWPEKNRCYLTFEQGPCKPDEWIVRKPGKSEGECQKNPCLHMKLQEPMKGLKDTPKRVDIFWFQTNSSRDIGNPHAQGLKSKQIQSDKCYQTFTKGYCEEGEYVRFVSTHHEPVCVKKVFEIEMSCPYSSTTLAEIPCAEGSKDFGIACVKIPEID